jgi:LysM repeat protein
MKKRRILIISIVVFLSFVFVSAVSADTNYIIRYGDTLWWIARQYGTTPELIQAANQGVITNIDVIIAGQTIVIPGGPGTGGFPEYIVQRGDTLFSIARRYGTTVAAIDNANAAITNVNLIYAGQTIVIPVATANPISGTGTVTNQTTPAETTTTAPTAGNVYIVKTGDGLYSIARTHNTTVPILRQLNPGITNPNYIRVGDKITLPAQ